MKKKMRNRTKRSASLFALPAASLLFAACDMEQTEEAEMPDVDVDYEEGNLPEYEVETADVDTGTTTETVKVPKVKVVVEEEEVEVPFVDVTMPGEDTDSTKQRQTFTAKVGAPATGYSLKIIEAFHHDDELAIFSKVTRTSDSQETKQNVPIQDTIVLNIPEVNATHYVIAPNDEFEGGGGDYEIATQSSDFDIKTSDYTRIYGSGSDQ